MRKINYIKELIAGVFLLIGIYCQSAQAYTEKECDDEKGLICWQCGENCTATLYDGGKMIVSGNGPMKEGSRSFFDYNVNTRIPQAITSVEFQEGITSIGTNALWEAHTIQQIKLADTIKRIDPDGIDVAGPWKMIISENSSLNFFAEDYGVHPSSIFCRGDSNKCREIIDATHPSYSNVIISNELRDNNNNLLEKCDSDGCERYNTTGNVSEKYDLYDHLLEKYNNNQKLIESYVYDSEGNQIEKMLYSYDGGGNLIKTYRNGQLIYAKKIYTPTEAVAVTQKGSKNIFSIRYR